MKLDRRLAASVCAGSFLIMAGSGFVMWSRWMALAGGDAAEAPVVDPHVVAGTGWPGQPPAAPVPAPAPAPVAPPAPPAPEPPAASGEPRRIRFSYRDSRPLKVEIVGSFNEWTPAALSKGENHTWSVVIPLAPGEYTYNFLVDGRPVRDPNNRRTASEGRSLIQVSPHP